MAVLGAILLLLLKMILIVLLLTVFLLFCPLCYKVKAEYGEHYSFYGRVSWLFGLVWFSLSADGEEKRQTFRLFGVDIQRVLAKWRKRRERKRTSEKALKRGEKKQAGKAVEEQEKTEREDSLERKSQSNPDSETEELEQDSLKERAERQGNAKRKKTQKTTRSFWKTWKQRLLDFWKALRQFFQAVRRLYRKLKKHVDWASEVKKFWRSENTRGMVCILKDNVLHLWRKLKPKVLRGSITFGTGDPCTTGQLLGVAAIFYAAYGQGIRVIPDFERARLEGNLLVKGRISLITILVILVRILLRDEWSQFRREAEQLKEAL